MSAVVAVVGILLWIDRAPLRQFEAKARSLVGRPEAELIAALGEPGHVVAASTLAGRTVDYP